jgi:hypothetical protein
MRVQRGCEISSDRPLCPDGDFGGPVPKAVRPCRRDITMRGIGKDPSVAHPPDHHEDRGGGSRGLGCLLTKEPSGSVLCVGPFGFRLHPRCPRFSARTKKRRAPLSGSGASEGIHHGNGSKLIRHHGLIEAASTERAHIFKAVVDL